MLLSALLLATLVLHQTAGAETTNAEAQEPTATDTAGGAVEESALSTVEGKDLGGGSHHYDDYDDYDDYHGKSYNNFYGARRYGGYGGYRRHHDRHHQRDHHGDHYGERRGYYHDDHHEHKHVPVKIPYLDQNGCRFPGEPVCNPAATAAAGNLRTTYVICLLLNESKNLWKKPTFTISEVITCPATVGGVTQMAPTDFCNANKKLLKAAGLIQEKDKHGIKNFHQGMFTVSLDPCFLAG